MMTSSKYSDFLRYAASLVSYPETALFRASMNSCSTFAFGDMDLGREYIPQLKSIFKKTKDSLIHKYQGELPAFLPIEPLSQPTQFSVDETCLLLANIMTINPTSIADLKRYALDTFEINLSEDRWESLLLKLNKIGLVDRVSPKTYISSLIEEYDLDIPYDQKRRFFDGAVRGFTPFRSNIPKKAAPHIINVRLSTTQERGMRKKLVQRSENYALFDPLSSNIAHERYNIVTIEPGHIEFLFDYFENKPFSEAGTFFLLSHPHVPRDFFERPDIPNVLRVGPESLSSTYTDLETYGFMNDEYITPLGERISGFLTRTPAMIMPYLEDIHELGAISASLQSDMSMTRLSEILFLSAAKRGLLPFYEDWNQVNELVYKLNLARYNQLNLLQRIYYTPWQLESKWNLSRFAIKRILSEQFDIGALGTSITSHSHLYKGD